MNILHAAFLGLVQGLTEFLPISSSGHLVLFQHLLGFQETMITFDVILHAGTLMAVLVYYANDLLEMVKEVLWVIGGLFKGKKFGELMDYYPQARIASYLLVATFPTGCIAILFHEAVESMFGSIMAVGVAWIITGTFLILTRKIKGDRGLEGMTHQDAFIIGIIQGIAIIPGISRSGSTIIAGIFCGLDRKQAAKFSFLMSIPAIVGANLLEIRKGMEGVAENWLPYLVGAATACIVAYITIAFLLKMIQKGNFFLFGFYCLGIGILTLGYCIFQGVFV